MKSFDRYNNTTKKRYNRRGISFFFMRRQADKVIIPYLKQLHNEKVLEAGIGYGYYTGYYVNNNQTTGYDINPELGKDLGIKILKGKASEINQVDEKFNRILSFFMTEYLSKKELIDFINGSLEYCLTEKGKLVTTIILRSGMGVLYTLFARLKSIRKYCYSIQEIEKIVKGKKHKIIPIYSVFNIPFACILEVEK